MILAKAYPDVLQGLRDRMAQFDLGEAIRQTEDTWGTSVTTAMKANHDANAHDIARYENQTFDLTESIGYDLQPTHGGGGIARHSVRVFAAVPYAYDVEMGVPGRSRAYPFFWKEVFSGTWTEAANVNLTTSLNDLLASVAERT